MLFSDKLDVPTEREFTEEGFLKVPARISRSGIQDYLAAEMGLTDRDPTDVIRVFRPEEEVFKKDSLSSFANKPITNNHPAELLTADNAREFMVGMSGPEVTKDKGFVKTTLTVVDAKAIEDITNGKVELSNGYLADIDFEEGVTPNGEKFDAVQRNIRGNHIAIVSKGRAGSDCRVADNALNVKEQSKMPTIKIDGIDFEMSDQAVQAVSKLQTRLSDAEKMNRKKDEELKEKEDQMEEEKKKSTKSMDELKAKLDDAEAKIPTGEALDKLVADRAAFIAKVRKLDKDLVCDGKDEATLRKEIVAAKCPNVQMDSVSDDYVSARFDMLVDAAETASDPVADALVKSQNTKDKEPADSRPASIVARDKMIERNRNAWKKAE